MVSKKNNKGKEAIPTSGNNGEIPLPQAQEKKPMALGLQKIKNY